MHVGRKINILNVCMCSNMCRCVRKDDFFVYLFVLPFFCCILYASALCLCLRYLNFLQFAMGWGDGGLKVSNLIYANTCVWVGGSMRLISENVGYMELSTGRRADGGHLDAPSHSHDTHVNTSHIIRHVIATLAYVDDAHDAFIVRISHIPPTHNLAHFYTISRITREHHIHACQNIHSEYDHAYVCVCVCVCKFGTQKKSIYKMHVLLTYTQTHIHIHTHPHTRNIKFHFYDTKIDKTNFWPGYARTRTTMGLVGGAGRPPVRLAEQTHTYNRRTTAYVYVMCVCKPR